VTDHDDRRKDDTRDRMTDRSRETGDLERALDESVERYRESQLRDQRERETVADKAKAETDRRAATDTARTDLAVETDKAHECRGDAQADVDRLLEKQDADDNRKQR